jgi:hypothetical protein
MSYEQKPNEATLWETKDKTETCPTKKGKLVITRSLLMQLAEQQGKGGDFTVDVSAWERVTKSGKAIINIKIEKPVRFGEQTPAPSEAIAPTIPTNSPTKPKYTPQDIAKGKLKKFKVMLQACKSLQEVIDLDHQLHEPDRWIYFEAAEAIANEAQDLLEEFKEKFAVKEPSDHSDILSKIDVELQRLGLHVKAHSMVRWGKSRAKLSYEELQIYLDELAIAEPIPVSDDFF